MQLSLIYEEFEPFGYLQRIEDDPHPDDIITLLRLMKKHIPSERIVPYLKDMKPQLGRILLNFNSEDQQRVKQQLLELGDNPKYIQLLVQWGVHPLVRKDWKVLDEDFLVQIMNWIMSGQWTFNPREIEILISSNKYEMEAQDDLYVNFLAAVDAKTDAYRSVPDSKGFTKDIIKDIIDRAIEKGENPDELGI